MNIRPRIWLFALVGATAIFSATLQTAVSHAEGIGQHQADLVIFSYDRPLQLYALLESLYTYARSLDTIHVVYRCSSKDYIRGYAQVWQAFPAVRTYLQSERPELDFKQLTLQALVACPHEYVLFAVDDMIVKDFIDCAECAHLLEQYDAYGFYLRMGKNLDACYSMSSDQPLPPFVVDDGIVCVWQFAQGMWDWKYPHTVDMTMYRKHTVIQDLLSFEFKHPTQLEGIWAAQGWKVFNRFGISFAASKVVNLPLNLVQEVLGNRHMNFMSCAELLSVFNERKKIDISLLKGIDNKSAHMEYVPTFIERIAQVYS